MLSMTILFLTSLYLSPLEASVFSDKPKRKTTIADVVGCSTQPQLARRFSPKQVGRRNAETSIELDGQAGRMRNNWLTKHLVDFNHFSEERYLPLPRDIRRRDGRFDFGRRTTNSTYNR